MMLPSFGTTKNEVGLVCLSNFSNAVLSMFFWSNNTTVIPMEAESAVLCLRSYGPVCRHGSEVELA
jgi:hypothetical protein